MSNPEPLTSRFAINLPYFTRIMLELPECFALFSIFLARRRSYEKLRW